MGLRAMITPEASTAERKRAFDINVRCLTDVRGCTELAEIMPSAWKDYQEYLRRHEQR